MNPHEKLSPPLWLEQLIEWKNELKNAAAQYEKVQIEPEEVHVKIASTKNGPQYYLLKKGQHNGKYISKTKLQYIKKLLQQEYNQKLSALLEKNLALIEKFTKDFTKNNPAVLYENMSNQRKKLITPLTYDSEQLSEKWKNTSSAGPQITIDEGKIYKTQNGELVRSKSEVMIANMLVTFKVPYKYEEPLRLGTKTVYPDFTCLNLRTHKEIIWEHLGLMDSQDYVAKNVSKIAAYENSGFISGKNLIVTMENKETVLTPQRIENIIREHLV